MRPLYYCKSQNELAFFTEIWNLVFIEKIELENVMFHVEILKGFFRNKVERYIL